MFNVTIFFFQNKLYAAFFKFKFVPTGLKLNGSATLLLSSIINMVPLSCVFDDVSGHVLPGCHRIKQGCLSG